MNLHQGLPLATAGTPLERARAAMILLHGRGASAGDILALAGELDRPDLAYLASLGALDAEGQVLHQHGVSLTVPGLYFVGLSNQRTFASATLRGVGPDAAVVVRHLTRHLAPTKRAFIPGRLRLAATQICCPTR